MKELVSIITPTYNHEKYIGQCIESVLAQTYPYWEQIIIDDGSTDATKDVITQYKDKRIKYIKQDNIGTYRLNETYNKALEYSNGDLVAILDGDDFWPEYKLAMQVRLFEDPDVILSYGKKVAINNDGIVKFVFPENLKHVINISQESTLSKLLYENFVPACTVMCRKDALKSIGGFKQPKKVPFVDYPTWLELSLKGKFLPVDETLGFWRLHEKQTSNLKLLQMAEAKSYSLKFYKKLPNEIRESLYVNYNDIKHNYENEIASTVFHLGRMNLSEKKWAESKINFKKAFFKGRGSLRFKSLVGFIFALFKWDLEYLAKKMNKPLLKDINY